MRRYPGVNFINGDAFDLDKTLGALKDQKFDSVISAVPLLNFPMQARIALLEDLLDRIRPDGRSCRSPMAPVSPIIARCPTATISSISTSSSAIFRRRSSGSTARGLSVFGLYITHPQVRIDPAVPVPKWGLSEIGAGARRKAAVERLGTATARGSSPATRRRRSRRRKSLPLPPASTVEIVAWHARKRPLRRPASCRRRNSRRRPTGSSPIPTESFRGWERAIDAQARIVSAVERVLSAHERDAPDRLRRPWRRRNAAQVPPGGAPDRRATATSPAAAAISTAFGLADRRLSCDWTPIEDWQGWI